MQGLRNKDRNSREDVQQDHCYSGVILIITTVLLMMMMMMMMMASTTSKEHKGS